jgi:TPP-dependent pyruvate/acetoin dehydrogenase alpha subunit
VTYRLGVHTTADDPSKYRSEEEVRAWERKDPLTRFRAYLEQRQLLEEGMERQVDEEIAAGVRRFEALPPLNPLTAFDHVYAELPPHLAAQRAELDARLAAEGSGPVPAPPPDALPMRGQRTTRR